jgi:GTP:adenosylcobinamide-phosphate guanylyltransferase
MKFPAVVTAGDRGAAKAVYGQSKGYLEIQGRPLVAHVVAALQRVPEISEVWVVGDEARLRGAFASESLRRELCKPLHLMPQLNNLYENAWGAYQRLLPGAGESGREPGPADLDTSVLYLSADLPFATAQEISAFVRQASALDCSYALGLVTEASMADFLPSNPDEPGIRMASFNLREGRFRQSNLHLVRPGRIINRHYIEELYRNRFQRELSSIVAMAWRLLTSERGGLRVFHYFMLMHLAGVADRRGFRRIADALRRFAPLERIEACCSDLLRASVRFVVTQAGGAAIDIDNEHDYDVAKLRFAEWSKAQASRAEQLYGPPALGPGNPESSGP